MAQSMKTLGVAQSAQSRGFSIIDLMVSIGVIVLLVSILTPTLVSAQEAARRAKCASNIRQLGIGLQMFAFDHNDRMPQSVFTTQSSSHHEASSQETIYVRIDPNDNGGDARAVGGLMWDGLGILADQNYADAPNVYYCPSHKGSHPYSKYKDIWLQRTGSIAGNYQYRIPELNTNFTNLRGNTTLIADGMRTQVDYNHVVGNNMLKADLSVLWFSDVGGALLRMLAENDMAGRNAANGVNQAWTNLDQSGSDGNSSTPGANQGSRAGRSGMPN